MGLIVRNDATMITLGEISASLAIGLLGILLIAILEAKKVRGSFSLS